MQHHPLVLEDHLLWDMVGDPINSVILPGQVICQCGVVITVEKLLKAWFSKSRRLEVEGERYSYNAHFAGRHNILRYDNLHTDPNEFHRHQFDIETGKEVKNELTNRNELPSLAGFFTEVATAVGFEMDQAW